LDSLARGEAFREVLSDLARYGYDAEWAGIPAAAFGASHLRYRVFIVAYHPSQQVGITGQPRIDTSMDVADAPSARHGKRESKESREIRDEAWRAQFERLGSHVANCAIFSQRKPFDEANAEPNSGQARPLFGSGSGGTTFAAMGQRVDGIFTRLDRGRLNAERFQERRENLQELQEEIRQGEVWGSMGGAVEFSQTRLLQLGMLPERPCQRHALALGLVMAGSETPWALLRTVWGYDDETLGPSHRRESAEQLAREYPDLVRALSHYPPPPSSCCWLDGSWEDGLARIANSRRTGGRKTTRVNQLRALGNAVVPQIAEWIGRKIIAFHEEKVYAEVKE
jgi:site-specific DNA-cytosine methylase